jgi:hypothetical protein
MPRSDEWHVDGDLVSCDNHSSACAPLAHEGMEMPMQDSVEIAELVQPYEPPHVESVLTAEDLTREVQYAGGGTLIT